MDKKEISQKSSILVVCDFFLKRHSDNDFIKFNLPNTTIQLNYHRSGFFNFKGFYFFIKDSTIIFIIFFQKFIMGNSSLHYFNPCSENISTELTLPSKVLKGKVSQIPKFN